MFAGPLPQEQVVGTGALQVFLQPVQTGVEVTEKNAVTVMPATIIAVMLADSLQNLE